MDAVCGPDEHNAAVNDSGYIIASAITTLNFAIELAELQEEDDAEEEDEREQGYNISGWKDVVKRCVENVFFFFFCLMDNAAAVS